MRHSQLANTRSVSDDRLTSRYEYNELARQDKHIAAKFGLALSNQWHGRLVDSVRW